MMATTRGPARLDSACFTCRGFVTSKLENQLRTVKLVRSTATHLFALSHLSESSCYSPGAMIQQFKQGLIEALRNDMASVDRQNHLRTSSWALQGRSGKGILLGASLCFTFSPSHGTTRRSFNRKILSNPQIATFRSR